MSYPDSIDYVWLATDADGRLAAMVTAGVGPMPPETFAADELLDVEDMMLALPVRGEAILHVEMPRPDSFIALSQRGLFVYDWSDIHRSRVAYIDAYELMSSPVVEIGIGALGAGLRGLAANIAGPIGKPTIRI